ncbi:UNVERIFIED_CONTAM: hypothetical protein Slati_1715300 [Sesamum latifolium]|uniref:GAG-pre-integrase domain-containing protein n=1 Tax=Sesamum latifolium TaxID=2727402 RepID=A0AAW2WY54_9LAMI
MSWTSHSPRLLEGSSLEERLTFEKWHEDNRKICRDKSIFWDQDDEGSSVHSHGVKMLSLVEKLEDLKDGLNNDTYIDVILQSLPRSYDPFIVNYNMNEFEKSIHELINMLVQYEATTHKSEPAVLVGEASTSKAKNKGARRWKRKTGKGTMVTATASTGDAPPAAPKGKGKGKVGSSQRSKANDVYMHCQGKRHWKRECPQLLSNPGMFVVEINMISNTASWVLDTGCGAHVCNDLQVLERSRRLSKDEMILRLGDGKAVDAEAVGSLRLHLLGILVNGIYILQQSNLIMNAQHKRKVDNPENAQIWHARLGHISKDRISRLVDSKNLEIDNLDHLPTCESYLNRKMTKKPFVGQSAIASSLLDLVHTNVCEPLSIPTRGEFSYFITFTDDHSRYDLYLPDEPRPFWGYALETAAKLLNIAPSKSVPRTPYEIWHGKPASYKYLRVWGSPAYVKRLVGDKLDSTSSLCRFIGYPKETVGYYFYDPERRRSILEKRIFHQITNVMRS